MHSKCNRYGMVGIYKKITMKYIIISLISISSISAQNVQDTITIVTPKFTGKYYAPPSGGKYEIWKDEEGFYFIVEKRKLYIK